jgi:outer membrane protein OmpA-like peptidoglycan-associated protein
MKKLALMCVLLLGHYGLFSQTMRSDTIHWYFQVNQYNMSDETIRSKASDLLDRIDTQGTHELVVISATDCSGSKHHNQHLAERRNRTISSWLSRNYPELTVKSVCIPEENCGTGEEQLHPPSRRVSLVIFRETPSEQVIELAPREEHIVTQVDEDSGMEDLKTASVGTTIVMEGFQFIGGRHIPLPESMPKLEELYEILRNNPSLHIEIAGHICCMGGEPGDGLDWDTGLENLSLARAQFVRGYLIDQGIQVARMTAVGYGSRVPLVFPERNESDAQKNRRVEIKITQQ